MRNNKYCKAVSDYLVMALACFLFAIAWEAFMIPNGMSSGGLMGLCTIIQFATFGAIDASISYIVINAVLILAAVVFFGVAFGFRTIYCIVLSSIMFKLVQNMEFLHCLPDHFFYVREPLVIPVISGILEAVAVGMILKRGGSTGGTDIIALTVNKYWPISLSKVFLVCDLVVISLLVFLPDKSFADMIYGFVMMLTFSMVIDVVVAGNKTSYQVMVFSDKYDVIADNIIHNMGRGVTVLKAQGWYTKNDKNVLIIIMSKKQTPALTKMIKEVDPRAFLTINKVGSVYGEGFEEIKTGIHRKKKKENEQNVS